MVGYKVFDLYFTMEEKNVLIKCPRKHSRKFEITYIIKVFSCF